MQVLSRQMSNVEFSGYTKTCISVATFNSIGSLIFNGTKQNFCHPHPEGTFEYLSPLFISAARKIVHLCSPKSC